MGLSYPLSYTSSLVGFHMNAGHHLHEPGCQTDATTRLLASGGDLRGPSRQSPIDGTVSTGAVDVARICFAYAIKLFDMVPIVTPAQRPR